MDKSSEAVLKKIYDLLNSQSEVSISSPEYSKEQIDNLVNNGYIEKLEASTLTGWSYIIRPTYDGKTYFENKKAANKAKFKHNTIEVVKFLIPTIISIIALIVSILK